MNTEKNTTDPDIAGYLKLKRGKIWVTRYVEINNGVLFYYKHKGDLDARCVINLKKARVGEGWGSDKNREIVIKSPDLAEGEVLKLKFHQEAEFKSWSKVINEATTSMMRMSSISAALTNPEEPKQQNVQINSSKVEENTLEPAVRNSHIANDSHVETYSLDLNLLKDNTEGLSQLKANVHQIKRDTQEMMLVHNSNNLRIFQNTKLEYKDKTKPLKALARDIAQKIAKGFIIDQTFGPFYFFLVLLIFLCLGFMSFYVMIEYFGFKSFFMTIIVTLHVIYITHQIILETIKIFKGKGTPKEIGVEELDLFKRGTEGYGPYKLKGITNIRANINEILYIFNHPETRIFWQTNTADIKVQQNENIVTYEFQGKKIKDKFSTTIYKENDLIYCVGTQIIGFDNQIDHDNLTVLRVFEITYNTNENNHVIRFYTSTLSKNLAQLQPFESPTALLGLNSYLTELIADPNSRLYTDYHFKGGDRVILRNNNYEIQKNYIRKNSSFIQEESDASGEADSDSQQKEQKILHSRTKSRDLDEIVELKAEEEIKADKESPTDLRITKYRPILDSLFERIHKVTELTPENKWEKIEEKDGNIIHFKDDAVNKCFYVRSEANIRAPMDKIMKGFEDYETRKHYDELLEKGVRYEQINDAITIERMFFKGMLTVSGRDFVLISERRTDEHGNLTVVAQSIEDARLPPEKKYVRGEIKIAGWMMKPHPEDKGLVNVIVIACTDLKGSIPRSLLTTVGKKQGLTVLGLKKYLDKQKS